MKPNHFDIVIIGGGAAGVAAAVSAAQENVSVCLIDRNVMIGGLATNAEVGTICGLYRYDRSKRYTYNVGKFAREFTMELQVRSGKIPQSDNTGLKYLPYSPTDFENLCNELLQENEVHRITGEIINVTVRDNVISDLSVSVANELITLTAKAIVDATGVSRVSKLAAQPLIETQFKQSASQVFTVSNLPIDEEKNLSLILLKALRKGVISGDLEEMEDRLYLVPGSLENGTVSLKITIPAPIEEEMSKAELKNRAIRTIEHIIAYLKSHEQTFHGVVLDSIAPAVGVRVGDRPFGKMILADDDVLKGKKSKSCVARGNWPMEIWSQAKRVELHYLEEGDFYDIPADSLISQNIDNLYFAGRCISATDMAIASARVIGTCLQTGYASGKLATSKCSGEAIEDIVEKIQSEQFNAN